MKNEMLKATTLKSERVIINSPMSFAGAVQRSFRLRALVRQPLVVWLLLTPAAVLLATTWILFIVCWYIVSIGLLWFMTIPYRILRRGARKRKAEALRHREVLRALDK